MPSLTQEQIEKLVTKMNGGAFLPHVLEEAFQLGVKEGREGWTFLVDMGDLLSHAQDLGYDWNNMCGVFYTCGLYPMDGDGTVGVSKGQTWKSEEVGKIVDSFCDLHGVKYFDLTTD